MIVYLPLPVLLWLDSPCVIRAIAALRLHRDPPSVFNRFFNRFIISGSQTLCMCYILRDRSIVNLPLSSPDLLEPLAATAKC